MPTLAHPNPAAFAAPGTPDPRPSDPLAFDRILSIDIFRGLTMVLMIFVNDLSSVQGLSRWHYHAHAMEDRMTYVDMVFPLFLFILGGAIPLAITRRLRRDPSLVHLVGHIALRSFALLVLGLILANGSRGDAPLMHGLNPSLWTLLALLGAALVWAVYPRPGKQSGSPSSSTLSRVLRPIGVLLLVAAFVLFRRVTRTGNVAWIDFSYPEILGLLAFTYLVVSLLYLLTRQWAWAPLFWIATSLLFNCAESARWVHFPNHLPLYIWPFSNGSMVLCAMSGLFCTEVLFGSLARRLGTTRNRILVTVVFGLVLLGLGVVLQPLGISKIRATPSWGLWCSGAGALILALLHWVCDLRHHTAWAFFARSAGSNTLLTYLLPDVIYFLFALFGFSFAAHGLASGTAGVLRAFAFTGAILLLSWALTRARVRLQL